MESNPYDTFPFRCFLRGEPGFAEYVTDAGLRIGWFVWGCHGAGSKIVRLAPLQEVWIFGWGGWNINVLRFEFPTTAKGKP